ncbi:MAG TPA: CsbD family protein [Ornithinicoccus sp.]|nr:CsbD family protein [Ornithinicoccus sp.]
MGIGDKMQNAAEEAKGKAKESYGDATDDKSMQAEGMMDQAKADAKQQGEKAKDAWKDATDQ